MSLSYTLAAPVLLGMMLKLAALPPLQSLADGPSTVFWVADMEVRCCHFTANYKYLPNNASTIQKIGQQKKKKLTSNGMNSRHQTLNDTKVVIDDLVYENRHH